mgnify:CR=1 FL=1
MTKNLQRNAINDEIYNLNELDITNVDDRVRCYVTSSSKQRVCASSILPLENLESLFKGVVQEDEKDQN